MSTMALSLNGFSFAQFIPKTPGFSKQASATTTRAKQAEDHFTQSKVSSTPGQVFMSDIFSVLENCVCEDWDGYGAQPVTAESIENAVNFFWNELEEHVRYPEVTPEPDGEIALEWYGAEGYSCSVSFDDKNNISYACILKDSRSRGVAKINSIDTRILRRHIENVLRTSSNASR